MISKPDGMTAPDSHSGQPRLRVLHLITRLIVGGAQDNTLLTAELHDRDRYEVHLAAGAEVTLHDRARASADAFHSIPSLRNPIHPLHDLHALWQIVALIKKHRFDIVHTHSSKAGLLGRLAARLAGVPIVVHTIHGSAFHPGQPAWKSRLFQSLERAARPMADYILTLSDSDRSELSAVGIVDPERSRTVYTGMDESRLVPTPGVQRSDTRQSLGVSERDLLILMVGRHDRQKAPDILVRAFARVAPRHPHAILALAGDGPIRPEVEELARQLGIADRVRFLGTRSDIPDLLIAADIFSFSSLREAMGRAMLEAMLLGRPVVVPRTSGIPEAVIEGETGLLFPVGDSDRLAEQLQYLLDRPDERARLGAAGQAHVRSLFGADTMVRSIEEVYDALLHENNLV